LEESNHKEGSREDDGEEVLLEWMTSFQSYFQIEMEKLRKEIHQLRSRKASRRSKNKVNEKT